jgi:hypothetical protein
MGSKNLAKWLPSVLFELKFRRQSIQIYIFWLLQISAAVNVQNDERAMSQILDSTEQQRSTPERCPIII